MKCSHCKQEFNEYNLITDQDGNKFCCNGCMSVFELLHKHGFSQFYDKLGKNTLQSVGDIKYQDSDLKFENLYKNYVKKTKDGFCEIFVIIDKIHCSACVWLNEKILSNTEGIVEVSVNGATKKARIVWDDDEIKLHKIFNVISSIGYDAFAYDPSRSQERMDEKRRNFYARLAVGIFCTMNMMWIAIALYGGYFTGMEQKDKDILHFAEFILATPVLFFTGSAFFAGAKSSIKNRHISMDLLICIGSCITYVYSVFVMFTRVGEVYFDSVCMIITFVFAGKYLEVLSQKNSTDTLDFLSKFIVNTINVKNGDSFELKNLNEIKNGDIIMVRTGDRVLIDGQVVCGSASFDYSGLTGESIPVFKQAEDEVLSGCVCIDGQVQYCAKSDFKNSTLNKIINLLENASFKKPKIEKMANLVSSKFSLVIIFIAILSFFGWMLYTGNFEKSLMVFVCVIVIACPCALGLATPVAALCGLASSLKRGIIFKESSIIETTAQCNIVVFDKTGTLTKSKLSVVNSKFYKEFDKNLLLNLLKLSSHPVSMAVFEHMSQTDYKILSLDSFKNIQAKGVTANFNGLKLMGGSCKFMQESGIDCPNTDLTNYYFCIDNNLVASFELEDIIREDAKYCIDNLKDFGFDIYLLSGDNENVVKKIAQKLDIKNYKAECLPDEKSQVIQDLQKLGKKVIMVGDGVNDCIAISIADVGVCLGSGSDVSIERSDIVLLKEDLNSFVYAIKISKKTLKTIKQNLLFSLCYNVITVPIAVAGLVIPPIAALSMSLSSIIVVLNSLRIKNIIKGSS